MLLDDKIVKCNIDTKDREDIYKFDTSQIMYVSISNNYYSIISKELKNDKDSGYSLISNRLDNTNISTSQITDSPKMFKNTNVLNYLIYQDGLQVINKWGVEIKNIKFELPPKNVITFNNGKSIALIYSNKIYCVNM